MDNKNKQQLGYKPNLVFVDEYYSDIDLNKSNNEINENNNVDNSIDNPVNDLINDMNNLHNIIDKLPGDLSDVLNEIYDPVLDFVNEELKDQVLDAVPEKIENEYEDYVPPTIDDNPTIKDDSEIPNYPNEDDDEQKKPPNMNDIWDTGDFFPIKKEEHEEHEITEKEYIKNLVDLFKDYNNDLENILTNFWTNLFIATNKKTSDEINMLLGNILLNSSEVKRDTRHLLDFAVRQNIVKTMRMQYFRMMYNLEETIKRLKQLKAMQELRLRYSNIEEVKGDTKTNQMNNNFLKASKLVYDHNYDKAYENLYRYLSSSNTVLNEALQTWIQEIKSKQILIERKGIL